MLVGEIPVSWGARVSNQTGNSTSPGTAVTPGASNSEGSWTEVLSSAALTTDGYWVTLFLTGGASLAAILVDIGVDPAGGTSYSAVVSDIGIHACTASNTFGGRLFDFPLYIPAGASVAVRAQSAAGAPGTLRVVMEVLQKPSAPVPICKATETVGTITGSVGVSLNTGAANTWGAWTSLGALTRDAFYALACVALSSGVSNCDFAVQLARGDGTNFDLIAHLIGGVGGLTQQLSSHNLQVGGFADLKAGDTLYMRIRLSASSSPSVWGNAIAFSGPAP